MNLVMNVLLLALACGGPAAALDEPSKSVLRLEGKPPVSEQLRNHELSNWFQKTVSRVGLSQNVAALLWQSKQPAALRIMDLAHQISREDPLLRRYLLHIEELLAKNNRLNPYDLKLLDALRLFSDEKRELADRVDETCAKAGLAKKPRPELREASLSRSPPDLRDADLRYDVDTGLWEKYDAAKKAWGPFEPETPGNE